jgi:Cu-Zn family superoxide dismutase
MIMKKLLVLLSFAMMATAGTAWGASQHVTMRLVDAGGVGEIIGLIEFKDTAKGLKIIPNLRGLKEGQHGSLVHQNPSCDPGEKDGKMVAGLGAGGHFDPNSTGMHQGPQGQGHLGDLPVLYVDAKGNANRSSWAPRLKTTDLVGRAIVIHSGGDNYSDVPKKLGGGGSRVACGLVVN